MASFDVEMLGLPAFVVNVEGPEAFRYVTMNRKLLEVSGFSLEQFAGKLLTECTPPKVAARLARNYNRCVEARSFVEYDEYYDIVAGRTWWSTTLSPEFDAEGRVVRIVGIAIDITNRVLAEQALANAVYTDHLTGVANRRRIELDVEAASEEAVYSQRLFSLVAVDIDRFKQINDEHGHRVGDQVLRYVARQLQASFRSSDTVARIGGDEFAIMVAARSEVELAGVLESLRRRLDQSAVSTYLSVRIGLSIGGALWQPGQEFDDLLSVADERMYRDESMRRAG